MQNTVLNVGGLLRAKCVEKQLTVSMASSDPPSMLDGL